MRSVGPAGSCEWKYTGRGRCPNTAVKMASEAKDSESLNTTGFFEISVIKQYY